MNLPYELLIGLRYTRAKRRNHFISIISLISMGGIALGVTALIVVLSVMNGFQKELRTRILGVASHIQITGSGGELPDWPAAAREMAQHPEVRAVAPFVQGQGMITGGESVRGTLIRGIDPELEDKVAGFRSYMKKGELTALKSDEFGVILGSDLAALINARLGDKVNLIVPQGTVTPAGVAPRLKTFKVVGIFEVGMYEYDSGLALIHLADAQKLLRLGDNVSGIRLKLDDLFDAPRIARQIARTAQFDASVSDWTRSHANFFRAVQIEKNMMFIILSLIVAVAAFNIVSTLVMAVTEKQADDPDQGSLNDENAHDAARTGAQRAQDGDIGTLVLHRHDQRGHNIEGGHGNNQQQDEEHHALFDFDGAEEIGMAARPVRDPGIRRQEPQELAAHLLRSEQVVDFQTNT